MPALEHLPVLREAVTADGRTKLLDEDLFWEACSRVLEHAAPALAPALHGGLLALLRVAQRRSREDVLLSVRAHNHSRDASGDRLSRFLLGLFLISREATWNDQQFMREVDNLMGEWDDESFHRSLPELRLAFSQHTPQETDRVARMIAELHSAESLGTWHHRDLDEDIVLRCSEALGRLASTLKQDHLSHFLDNE
jgi:hypothetical protein